MPLFDDLIETLGNTIVLSRLISSETATSSPNKVRFSNLDHFPILHLHPIMLPSMKEWLFKIVWSKITEFFILTPDLIITPFPITTFGPIKQSSGRVTDSSYFNYYYN